MVAINTSEATIVIGFIVMLAVAIPVDPRKSLAAKWIYWFVGPMLSTALLAVASYGAVRDPGLSDMIGAFVTAAVFSYIGFGGIYLRKTWPVGRWGRRDS